MRIGGEIGLKERVGGGERGGRRGVAAMRGRGDSSRWRRTERKK